MNSFNSTGSLKGALIQHAPIFLNIERSVAKACNLIEEAANQYFLDGRDPNSYANAAWIFGLHDRPWPERAVFGKVRSMSAIGLERKANVEGYVERINGIVRSLGGGSN